MKGIVFKQFTLGQGISIRELGNLVPRVLFYPPYGGAGRREYGINFQETDQLVEDFSLDKRNQELPLKNIKKIKSASLKLRNSA